jgi:hypothetical protein
MVLHGWKRESQRLSGRLNQAAAATAVPNRRLSHRTENNRVKLEGLFVGEVRRDGSAEITSS